MTAAELDRLILHLRAADAASARGLPALAALHSTIVRATMYRAGLRYGNAREVDAIDHAINQAMRSGDPT